MHRKRQLHRKFADYYSRSFGFARITIHPTLTYPAPCLAQRGSDNGGSTVTRQPFLYTGNYVTRMTKAAAMETLAFEKRRKSGSPPTYIRV